MFGNYYGVPGARCDIHYSVGKVFDGLIDPLERELEFAFVRARRKQQTAIAGMHICKIPKNVKVIAMKTARRAKSAWTICAIAVDSQYHGLAGAVVNMERLVLVCIANQVRPGETRFVPCELFYDLPNRWVHRQVFERSVECKRSQIVFVMFKIPKAESDRQFFGRQVDITVGSVLSSSQLLLGE